MELYVLNKSFNSVAVIDEYESINWTDRYNEAGDFELTLLMSKSLLDIFVIDYYLYYSGSDHLMIIEGLEVKVDDEKGDRLIVTGRSLESILDRRIVWEKTRFTLANNFQNAIMRLVTEAFSPINTTWGNATAENRRLSNFRLVYTYDNDSGGPLERDMKMDAIEYWGENLYDIITDLCKSRDPDVGYKILWDPDGSPENAFRFSLYIGKDRSSDNTEGNPPVWFSPDIENIFNTDYYESIKGYKTTTLIVGQYPKPKQNNEEDTVIEDKTTYVFRGSSLTTYTGLNRREVFCDARNVPYKEDRDGKEYVYNWKTVVRPALQEEGRKTLSSLSNKKAKTFEGEVDYSTTYAYGVDYKLGDVVDVMDVYGHETKARIVEVTFSNDEEGFSINPTFEMFGEVVGGESD